MRVLAHNIDLIPIIAVAYILSFFVEYNLVLYPMILFVYLIYGIGFELSPMRGSPGKYLNKLMVVRANYFEPTPGVIIKRNLYKIISIIPFFIGFTIAMFTPKKQALHDILAGTLVVKKESLE
jgi:uncharacterized RDD family membrane protein YckC